MSPRSTNRFGELGRCKSSAFELDEMTRKCPVCGKEAISRHFDETTKKGVWKHKMLIRKKPGTFSYTKTIYHSVGDAI